MQPEPSAWPRAVFWWIDAVGGYRVFLEPPVTIGQMGAGAELELMANVSARHAELRWGVGGAVLTAREDAAVNGKPGNTFLLRDRDKIKLRDVEFNYRRPIAWSSTGVLSLASRHRMPLALDGIVLMGETCVVGDRADAHIRSRWTPPVTLQRQADGLWVFAPGAFQVDGEPARDRAKLTPRSEVRGSWGSFRFEPAAPSG